MSYAINLLIGAGVVFVIWVCAWIVVFLLKIMPNITAVIFTLSALYGIGWATNWWLA